MTTSLGLSRPTPPSLILRHHRPLSTWVCVGKTWHRRGRSECTCSDSNSWWRPDGISWPHFQDGTFGHVLAEVVLWDVTPYSERHTDGLPYSRIVSYRLFAEILGGLIIGGDLVIVVDYACDTLSFTWLLTVLITHARPSLWSLGCSGCGRSLKWVACAILGDVSVLKRQLKRDGSQGIWRRRRGPCPGRKRSRPFCAGVQLIVTLWMLWSCGPCYDHL
jgi:hypothetical protein